MLVDTNDVCRLRVRASDGELGRVCDFFFDERTFTIRHVVVTTGEPSVRRVLVPCELLGHPDWKRDVLDLAGPRRAVEADAPVRVPVPQTYGARRRCRPSFVWAYGAAGMAHGRVDRPRHLRSARALNGFRVEARDGRCGVLEGLLFESADWTVRHLVVGLGWIGATHALLPPAAITAIDESDQTVLVALARRDLERARRLVAPAGPRPAAPAATSDRAVRRERHAAERGSESVGRSPATV